MTKRMQKILLGFSLLLAVPLLAGYVVYFGYCHSWWGKDSLLFRSLWLCSCPAGFEETLYPDYVDVAFSACNEVRLFHVFPDDRYLLVDNDQSRPGMPRYFWDPLTDERKEIHISGDIYDPLTSELALSFFDENHYRDLRGFATEITIGYLHENVQKKAQYLQIQVPPLQEDGSPNREAFQLLYPIENTKLFVQAGPDNVAVYVIPPATTSITPTYGQTIYTSDK